MRELAEGDDEGWFAEDGAVWSVHAGMGTLVAGIRALLIQALHPGALAGVHDFSRYREDPISRLNGTVRWVLSVTYGSRAQAERETARVARLHRRVSGDYVGGDGTAREYSASSPDLVEWVHLAFADAFLTAHQVWGGPIPGGADAYVHEWVAAGRLMHVPDPRSAAQLRARLDSYLERGELRADERTHDVVAFLRRPAFSGTMGIAYRALFSAAVATIPRRYRRMLGVRRSILPVITMTRIVLAVAERALGSGPRAQDFARRRLARLASAQGADEPA